MSSSDGSNAAAAPAALPISYALAAMHTGELLDELPVGRMRAELEGMAATLPDLFGTLDPNCLERISERLGSHAAHRGGFDEILVLSAACVHVIQPLTARAGVALLAVSPALGSVGLILSAVHSYAAALELR